MKNEWGYLIGRNFGSSKGIPVQLEAAVLFLKNGDRQNYVGAMTKVLEYYVYQEKNTQKADSTTITNHLYDIRSAAFKKDILRYLDQQTAQQTNHSSFQVHKSQQSSFESIAASFGISGSYGFYSGSVHASMRP